jgi:transcriptional regulator with XRE-family HTH domain
VSIKKIKMNNLGDVLRKIREKQELTRDQAAERAGLYRYTVISVESGHIPSLKTLNKLLRAYGYKIYIGRTKDVEGQGKEEAGRGDRREGLPDPVRRVPDRDLRDG